MKDECSEHFRELTSPRPKSTTAILSTSEASTSQPSLVSTLTFTTPSSSVEADVQFLTIAPEKDKKVNSFTLPSLQATKASVLTRTKGLVAFLPSGTETEDSQEPPSPNATSTSIGDQNASVNPGIPSKFLIPVTVAGTIVVFAVIAVLALLFLRRRKQHRDAQVLDLSLAPQPLAANSNNDTVADLETGGTERPVSTSSKEGLLFRQVCTLDDPYHNGKAASGLFATLERDSEIEEHESHADAFAAGDDKDVVGLNNLTFMTGFSLYLGGEIEEEESDEKEDDEEDLRSSGKAKNTAVSESAEALADDTKPLQDPQTSVHTWTVQEVQTWMNSAGLREEVVEAFGRHQIDGQRLLGLTDRILEHELEVQDPRIRSSILLIRARTFMNI
ncbi:hypothetical protein HDU97_001989 [Phlyctochytrium planicorne]|nr:hypothetical protein HDU97_001989 [Phlyctochytrium planicorne]